MTWLGTETHLELRGVGSYVGEGEVDGRILGSECEGIDVGVGWSGPVALTGEDWRVVGYHLGGVAEEARERLREALLSIAP